MPEILLTPLPYICAGILLFLAIESLWLMLACRLLVAPILSRDATEKQATPVAVLPTPSFHRAFGIVFLAHLGGVLVFWVLDLPFTFLESWGYLHPQLSLAIKAPLTGLGILTTVFVYAALLPTSVPLGFRVFFFQLRMTALLGIVVAMIAMPIILAR